jgi:hypothetical protein
MRTTSSRVQQFLLHALVPIVSSVVLGFVFYQDGVFNQQHGSFQFVWSGVVASIFYYLLVFLRPREAYLGLFVLLLLTFVTTHSTHAAYILRDIFYVGAIGVSVLIYFNHFRQRAHINLAYPAITFAGLYAIIYIIASEVHLGLLRILAMEDTGGSFVSIASSTAFFGVLIGFAVGCGITVAEKLFGKVSAE